MYKRKFSENYTETMPLLYRNAKTDTTFLSKLNAISNFKPFINYVNSYNLTEI